MKKNYSDGSDEEFEEKPIEVESSTNEVIIGANDFLELPIEKIREELKKRGAHPKYVDKCSHLACVRLLHEINGCGSIFSADKEEVEEKEEKEREEREKEEREKESKVAEEDKNSSDGSNKNSDDDNGDLPDEEFDPSLFMKENSDSDEDSEQPYIIKNNNTDIPAWQSKYRYSDLIIENFVPESVLNSLPLAAQNQVRIEIDNLQNYTHRSYNAPNVTTFMSIPEIIQKIIIPNANKGKVDSCPVEESQSTTETNSTDDSSESESSSDNEEEE